MLLAGYGSLHWMESPSFCGQVCHTPMHPQFTAWRGRPHARVACVECHIGEGADGFVHAKLAACGSSSHVATNSFPTTDSARRRDAAGGPGARPAARCHQPGRAVGDRIRVIREYADDEANTETVTMLQMHLGGALVIAGRAIHWHANPAVRIEYVATDAERQTIPYIRVTDANGR